MTKVEPVKAVIRCMSHIRTRELFDYNTQTGDLIWRRRPIEDFKTESAFKKWNVEFSGAVAGSIDSKNYRTIIISNKSYKAHRLVWAYHHDNPAEFQIDHINHNKSDNRIENLRLVTNAENQRNAKLRSDNTSGYVGVTFHKAASKWMAKIKYKGKVFGLGFFANKDDAITARSKANKKFGYHENHGKTP